jgi:membrane fusion protein, multidrug efflux system
MLSDRRTAEILPEREALDPGVDYAYTRMPALGFAKRRPVGFPANAVHAALLIFLAALPALLAGCDEPKAAGASAAPPPPQVSVITVRQQPVARTTELPGRTTAYTISDVRPQVSGVIIQRLFTEGSEVKEGQQLYLIDPRPLEAQLKLAQAIKAKDQASLENAKLNLARDAALLPQKLAITQQQYDTQHALVSQLIAQVDADAASVDTAQLNLNYTKVLSPIGGRIGRSTVTPGALVTADQASAIATVTQLDPIYVDVHQSSATLLRLQQELAAGELESSGDGAAKVTLQLEDGTTYPVAGKLEFTEVTVDEGTGTVLLRAVFPNAQHLLLPGMYVHAELEEGVNRNGMLVPQQAVSRNTHGDATVLVIGDGNKAELRLITTGPAVGDQWVVTGGLKPGDRVIVDGLQKVRPGTAVQAVAASAAAANAKQS